MTPSKFCTCEKPLINHARNENWCESCSLPIAPEPSKCCEECEAYEEVNEHGEPCGAPYCGNPSCPCHQPSKCSKCYGTGRYGANGSEECPDCHTPTQDVAPSWESRFDEKFIPVDWNFHYTNELSDELKSFIRQLLSEAEQRLQKGWPDRLHAQWMKGCKDGAAKERASLLRVIEGMKEEIRVKEGNPTELSETGNVVYYYLHRLAATLTNNEEKV